MTQKLPRLGLACLKKKPSLLALALVCSGSLAFAGDHLFFGSLNFAGDKLRQVQRDLNALQLDAGPVDGAWGPRTQMAVAKFLDHRGIPFDGELGEYEYNEIRGQRDYPLPKVMGFRLCGPEKFTSSDTYKRSEANSGEFSVKLKSGDYDYAEYRDKDSKLSVYSSAKNLNLSKQRAELFSCDQIKHGKTYTLDFEVNVDHASAGTIFQLHAGGPEGSVSLQALPDSIRFNAGQSINNVAIFRGDWLGRWIPIRFVFKADAADEMFFRFYLEGEEKLDTRGTSTDFGFSRKGATLTFGLYRGNSSIPASASYRKIRLQQGDQGAPN